MRALVLVLAACGSAACGSAATSPLDGGQDLRGSDLAPAPPPCSGKAGDFHSQPLAVGSATRYYFLHVPAAYDCGRAWPLLVDFHGTGTGAPTDPVEELWAFPEMIDAADGEGFLVVRPRSLFALEGSTNVFQWDINAGDLARNHAFVLALVADLETRYHIDPNRVYAAGFSNGPTMALRFLADEPSIMHGYMVISGGLNTPLARATPLAGSLARIYIMVGYRDYMYSATRTLYSFLTAHNFPSGQVWERHADTGHELYGWHYHEAFRWLDRGARPAAGTLSAGWTKETFPTSAQLVQLARDPAGRLYAAGDDGAIYRRAAAGAWSALATLATAQFRLRLSDLCFLADGRALAVGDGYLATSADGQTWSAPSRIAEFSSVPQFGYTHLTTVGCAQTRAVGGGVWSSAVSDDGGATWSAATIASAGFNVFVSAVRPSASGSWVGAGYYYLGRSTDGATFSDTLDPTGVQWLNDAAPAGATGWWAVGEKGALASSSDGGATFSAVPPVTTEDLYAIRFADGTRGIAVGSHGAAIATRDGGATWRDVSTGLDGFLGDAAWLDATHVLVAGEGGLVLTRTDP